MFILYIYIVIFLTVNTSQLTRVEPVSCTRYESDNKQLLSISAFNSDKKDEQTLRLEVIKQKILKKLGLEEAPKVDEQISNSIANDPFFDDILEDFDEQEDAISKLQDERTSSFNSDQSNALNGISNLANDELIDQVYLFPVKSRYKNKFLFNLTSKNNRLANIDQPKHFLLTLKQKPQNDQDDSCVIRVHKQIKESTDSSSNNLKDIGLLKNVDHKSSTSNLIKYNLNNLIPEFLKNRPTIDLSAKQEEQFILFDSINCDFESAMLTIGYESNDNQRSRRSLDCAPNGQTSGCCREPFFVNFTLIGWNSWILQPSGYNAYYCKGKCDLSHSRYMYTTISYTFPSVISQCCSPREMSSISMIYVDKDNYVYKKNLPEMVVDKCDCA